MLDRREFLRKAAKIAGGGALGLAAMHSFGMGAVKEAMAWGPLPAIVASKAIDWSTWNGLDQTTITADFSCLHDASGAGDDDTGYSGRGTLAGADLVLTEVGTVPAAAGSPLTRTIDGTSMNFTTTQNLLDTILSNASKKWTIILRATDFTRAAFDYFFRFAGAVNGIHCADSGASKFQLYTKDAGTNNTVNSVNDLPANGPITVYAWCDGGVARAAFDTTGNNLTKLSEFVANQVCTTVMSPNFTGNNFATKLGLYCDPGGNFLDANVQFVLMDSTCLINNSA